MKESPRLAIAFALLFTGMVDAAELPDSNSLARESSPYLRQHAQNPVHWFAWGPEAFAKAQAENKLVFLSIGYSSCHWCHVMERESFSDAGIAKLLNESFVCIKVDREERPDIDQVYLTALQCCGISGGWPLSMFLTPQGKPIIGGTYWPPDDKLVNGQRLPGFKGVLQKVIALEKDKPRELRDQAEKVADLTRRALGEMARVPSKAEPSRGLVEVAVEVLREGIDPEYGGFGNPKREFRGAKFPSTPSLDLLWQVGVRRPELRKPVLATLTAMARGGIYDQIGGGFHRYSTERTWTVPHFEKMLYDNAQLVEQFATAFTVTKDPLFRRVIDETLAFVRRDLAAPGGGFHSSLDADAEHEEGKTYVWTKDELAAALPDQKQLALATRAFGLETAPNFESRAFVLTRPDRGPEDAAAIQKMRERLRGVRDRRPQPFLDTKILCGWNGEMIAALAVAGQALAEPTYVNAAEANCEFILSQMRLRNGRLAHSMASIPGESPQARGAAFLDDYAFVIHGLLALHDATQNSRWLKEAVTLTEAVIEQFSDPDSGGFFYTSAEHDQLFVRCKDQYDGAQPSGNSVMVRNLLRLSARTGERRFRDLADKSLRAFAGALDQKPAGLSTMAAGMDLALESEPMNPLPAEPQKPAAGAPAKSEDVVKASIKSEKPTADGKQTIKVTLKIDKGWHLYANPIGNPDLESSQTVVTASSKSKPLKATIEYPKGKLVKDAVVGDYSVYSDEITITAIVQRTPGDLAPVDVAVKLQACNDRKCLLPATIKLVAP